MTKVFPFQLSRRTLPNLVGKEIVRPVYSADLSLLHKKTDAGEGVVQGLCTAGLIGQT